jgi:hypothetical protein
MKKQWKNLNINPQRLAETIQNQYTRKSLRTKLNPLKKGWQIYIIIKQSGTPALMSIAITGKPNNFTIETKATEEEDEAIKIGLSTQIFGGGSIFLLSSLKAREQLEKLEQEFWTTIEETIAKLKNSTSQN